MHFHIARAAAHTGAILRGLVETELRAERIQGPADATVCYGVGLANEQPHTLNANCSRFNKMTQGQRLSEAGRGVWGLGVIPAGAATRDNTPLPWLARKAQHTQGKDIMLVLEPWQIEARIAAGAVFFTPYVPSIREYRTWVYRKRLLGTYEKELIRPAECKRIGRNYANGFDFSFRERENLPEPLKQAAVGAIAALGLDFGAVDLIETPDHRYVVLEVNSAPGVQNERRRVIQALAHRVVRWMAAGCPNRNGAE